MRATLVVIGAVGACAAAGAEMAPDGQWRSNAGAALSYTSGNTNAAGANLRFDAERETGADKISTAGNINYARSEIDGVDTTTADKWRLFGRYDYNLTPRAFIYGKLGLEGDKLVDLSLRIGVDGGIGYKLVDDAATTFSVFGGAGYSSDRYASPQLIDGEIGERFSRGSVSLGEESLHRLTPTVELRQRLEYNPAISGDRTTLTKFTAGLAVKMTETLSLTVNVTDSYNDNPPAGTERNDFGFFTGISMKFGPK